MTVIGFEGEPHVELQRAVGSADEPVGAALQHRAFELRAFEATALDHGDTVVAERRLA
jgi:hypothetical protein